VGADSSTSSSLFDPPGGTTNTLDGPIVVAVSELFLLELVFLAGIFFFLTPLFFLLETFWASYK
jgi:hypothetical protein